MQRAKVKEKVGGFRAPRQDSSSSDDNKKNTRKTSNPLFLKRSTATDYDSSIGSNKGWPQIDEKDYDGDIESCLSDADINRRSDAAKSRRKQRFKLKNLVLTPKRGDTHPNNSSSSSFDFINSKRTKPESQVCTRSRTNKDTDKNMDTPIFGSFGRKLRSAINRNFNNIPQDKANYLCCGASQLRKRPCEAAPTSSTNTSQTTGDSGVFISPLIPLPKKSKTVTTSTPIYYEKNPFKSPTLNYVSFDEEDFSSPVYEPILAPLSEKQTVSEVSPLGSIRSSDVVTASSENLSGKLFPDTNISKPKSKKPKHVLLQVKHDSVEAMNEEFSEIENFQLTIE